MIISSFINIFAMPVRPFKIFCFIENNSLVNFENRDYILKIKLQWRRPWFNSWVRKIL